jgi:hypothetical protein
VQRDAARGEKLGEGVLKRVVATSLDKGDEPDALGKLSPERRHAPSLGGIESGEGVISEPRAYFPGSRHHVSGK